MIVVADKAPCQLRPGEVKRLPARADNPVRGYYVCCPRCWFCSLLVVGSKLTIREPPEGLTIEGETKCVYCRVDFGIREGEFHLVEGPDVRAVQYRK